VLSVVNVEHLYNIKNLLLLHFLTFLRTDSGSVSSPREAKLLDASACMMDKSFFEHFVRCECNQWLAVKNIQSFTVNNLWGTVTVKCEICDIKNSLTTVITPKKTTAKYVSSVDAVGTFVSKAEKLFLCDDMLPPRYQYIINMKSAIT
jgi:hypothetical protein